MRLNLIVRLIVGASVVILSGCGFEKPSANRNTAGVQFNHNGFIANGCASCHEKDRTLGALGTTNPPYQIYTTHGNGGDCVTCHQVSVSPVAATSADWLGKLSISAHTPRPTSCNSCHTAILPTAAKDPNHPALGTHDCVDCHLTPGNRYADWVSGAFSHNPTPVSCNGCHLTDTKYTSIMNAPKNQMNHSAVTLPDCATCHTSAAVASGFSPTTGWVAENIGNGTFTSLVNRGVFHNGIGGNPTVCSNCHSNERPQGSIGNPPFDHATGGGTGDCVSCHTSTPGNIGITWAGGAAGNHTAPFVSCISCHGPSGTYRNDLPTPAGTMVPTNRQVISTFFTYGGFDHSATFGGTADCVQCHVPDAAAQAKAGTTWLATGFYSHAGFNGTTNCLPCHGPGHPPGSSAPHGTSNTLSATNYYGKCQSCHTSTTFPAIGAGTAPSYGGRFNTNAN